MNGFKLDPGFHWEVQHSYSQPLLYGHVIFMHLVCNIVLFLFILILYLESRIASPSICDLYKSALLKYRKRHIRTSNSTNLESEFYCTSVESMSYIGGTEYFLKYFIKEKNHSLYDKRRLYFILLSYFIVLIMLLISLLSYRC